MKLYRNIIVIFLILAVLGGALYFVTQYNPETEPENPVTEETGTENDMVSVYKASTTDVAAIDIKNAEEEYSLQRIDNKWLLNGDASIRIKQTAADAVAYSCTSISVKQVVSENESDAEKYGFDAPVGCVKVSFKDGSEKTVTIGSLSLDKENYYIMLSGDPKIYLKNTYGTESMMPSVASLRDMLLITVDSTDLSNLTHFYMNKQGNTPVKMEYQNIGTNDKPKMMWKMTEPVYAEMNGQVFVDDVISKLENLEAVAVIEDHPKDVSLYGLDNPYASFSVGKDNSTFAFKIGNETENYRYIMEYGYETVYVVRKSDISFLDTAYMDLMSNLIHVEYIDTVNRIEITSPDKQYHMVIKNDSTYFINDTKIKKEDFSSAYQAVIGISLNSLDFSAEPDIAPEVQIKYYKKDDSVATVVFLPIDERNYRVTVDGKGNSITSKKNVTDVLSKLDNTIAQAN